MEISLNALINRQNLRMAELWAQQETIDPNAPQHVAALLQANIKTTEDRIDELNGRLERRRTDVQKERYCTIAAIQHVGQAWVLPHPERTSELLAPMVRDEDIERIAVNEAIRYEEARGWKVQSVEKDNRGFDLISHKPHPDHPETAIEVRFIEVKGRSVVVEVALTRNEFLTAERLKEDYWLYVVYNCATQPELHDIQDPARLQWQAVTQVEHYRVGAKQIIEANS